MVVLLSRGLPRRRRSSGAMPAGEVCRTSSTGRTSHGERRDARTGPRGWRQCGPRRWRHGIAAPWPRTRRSRRVPSGRRRPRRDLRADWRAPWPPPRQRTSSTGTHRPALLRGSVRRREPPGPVRRPLPRGRVGWAGGLWLVSSPGGCRPSGRLLDWETGWTDCFRNSIRRV